MSLVNYSDSDSDADTTKDDEVNVTSRTESSTTATRDDSNKRKAGTGVEACAKRTKLPPLPLSLHSQYVTNARSSNTDDPSLHGGRQRQIPHVRGQWPSHVYLEWFPATKEFAGLEELIIRARARFEPRLDTTSTLKINSFLQSALDVQLPLHVSLSAPLLVDTSSKDNFASELVGSLRTTGIRAFRVCPTGLDWVSNQEKSRFFLVLRLSQPREDQLNELLTRCNEICDVFNLPLLYVKDDAVGIATSQSPMPTHDKQASGKDIDKSSAFHISIAWTLQEPSQWTKQDIRTFSTGELGIEGISFTDVKIKIGNSISQAMLLPDLAETIP